MAKFSLFDFEPQFRVSKIEDSAASTDANWTTRLVCFDFDPSNNQEDILQIRRCAFHEVCELLLSGLYVHLERFYAPDFVQGLGHMVIRRMEMAEFGFEGISDGGVDGI